MFDRIIKAFTPTPTPEARKGAEREIVRARSHGNVRLQFGQYYTKKDVDAKFNRLRGVNFAD